MQLVINITEELYEANNRGLEAEEVWDLRTAIANGTALPKGHGSLIDVSELTPDADYEDGIFGAVSCQQIVEAEVIIEADSEE